MGLPVGAIFGIWSFSRQPGIFREKADKQEKDPYE